MWPYVKRTNYIRTTFVLTHDKCVIKVWQAQKVPRLTNVRGHYHQCSICGKKSLLFSLSLSLSNSVHVCCAVLTVWVQFSRGPLLSLLLSSLLRQTSNEGGGAGMYYVKRTAWSNYVRTYRLYISRANYEKEAITKLKLTRHTVPYLQPVAYESRSGVKTVNFALSFDLQVGRSSSFVCTQYICTQYERHGTCTSYYCRQYPCSSAGTF